MRLSVGMVALLMAVGCSPSRAEEKKKPVTPAPAVPVAATTPAPADAAAKDRITVAELKKLVAANKVLVVDVRSAEAYKTSHIAGSISAPLTDFQKHIVTLKAAKKPIVTYCT